MKKIGTNLGIAIISCIFTAGAAIMGVVDAAHQQKEAEDKARETEEEENPEEES